MLALNTIALRFVVTMFVALFAATACTKQKPAAAAPAVEAKAAADEAKAPADEASEIWNTRCATCHGAEGKGDGVASAALKPKPASFHDQEWQGSVTDENIAKAIVEGGPAVGKNALMPPNVDLKDKAAVVAELVKTIRSYKK